MAELFIIKRITLIIIYDGAILWPSRVPFR